MKKSCLLSAVCACLLLQHSANAAVFNFDLTLDLDSIDTSGTSVQQLQPLDSTVALSVGDTVNINYTFENSKRFLSIMILVGWASFFVLVGCG